MTWEFYALIAVYVLGMPLAFENARSNVDPDGPVAYVIAILWPLLMALAAILAVVILAFGRET